jgi:hypothetical protein
MVTVSRSMLTTRDRPLLVVPSTEKQNTSSYAGTWALSYIVPLAIAGAVYALTHSVAAGVVTVIVGFVLFMMIAAKRR